jgi:hypothetical protein
MRESPIALAVFLGLGCSTSRADANQQLVRTDNTNMSWNVAQELSVHPSVRPYTKTDWWNSSSLIT